MITNLQRYAMMCSVAPGALSPVVVSGDSIVTDSGNLLIDGTNFIVGDGIYITTESGNVLTDGTNLINHIRHG